jgi:hypothetical protein
MDRMIERMRVLFRRTKNPLTKIRIWLQAGNILKDLLVGATAEDKEKLKDWQANENWYRGFKKRFRIVYKSLHGEGGEVDLDSLKVLLDAQAIELSAFLPEHCYNARWAEWERDGEK